MRLIDPSCWCAPPVPEYPIAFVNDHFERLNNVMAADVIGKPLPLFDVGIELKIRPVPNVLKNYRSDRR